MSTDAANYPDQVQTVDSPSDISADHQTANVLGQCDLLLKMYDTLRTEIENFMNEIGRLVIYGNLATGAIWTWVLTNHATVSNLNPLAVRIFLFLPATLAVFFFIRSHALRLMIHKASDHIALIEASFGLDKALGWDSFWKDRRNREETMLFKSTLGSWLYLIWSFLIAVNFAAGVVCALSF